VPFLLVGPIPDLIDRVRARRDRYGFTHWIVPDDAIEAFAPVVAALVGTT
jgi:hypothetical protein